MGYMRHDTIVVTGGDHLRKDIEEARAAALEMGLIASEIVQAVTNGYLSFFIAPDGSKEGWDTSNEGESSREGLLMYLVDLDYVYVSFGGDDQVAKIREHSGSCNERSH